MGGCDGDGKAVSGNLFRKIDHIEALVIAVDRLFKHCFFAVFQGDGIILHQFIGHALALAVAHSGSDGRHDFTTQIGVKGESYLAHGLCTVESKTNPCAVISKRCGFPCIFAFSHLAGNAVDDLDRFPAGYFRRAGYGCCPGTVVFIAIA